MILYVEWKHRMQS